MQSAIRAVAILLLAAACFVAAASPVKHLSKENMTAIQVRLIYPRHLQTVQPDTLLPILFRISVTDQQRHRTRIYLEKIAPKDLISVEWKWPWWPGSGHDGNKHSHHTEPELVTVKELGRLNLQPGTLDYSMILSIDSEAVLEDTANRNYFVISIKQVSRWGWRRETVYQTEPFQITTANDQLVLMH